MRLVPRPLALIPALALLSLAACKQEPSVSATNATPSEVQEKVAAATGGNNAPVIRPGRWEGAMTISEMDIPNMPPQVRDQMKKRMGEARNFVSCVTEEDVRKQKAFFTGDENDKSCKYDHFNMAGGKIDAALSCDRGAQGKMAMTMSGTYGPEHYAMNMSSKAESGAPMGAMTMKMNVEATRKGECRGTKDEL